MKPVVLPGPGDWTLKEFSFFNNTFLVAVNPQQEPRVIGRTARGEVFVRKLTLQEKAVTG